MGAKQNNVGRLDRSANFDKVNKHGNDEESDYEPAKESFSSHSSEYSSMIKNNSRAPKKINKKESSASYLRPSKISISRQDQKSQEQKNLQLKSSINGLKKSHKVNKVAPSPINLDIKTSANTIVPLKPSFESVVGTNGKSIEEVKEIDIFDEAPICDQSVGTDDSVADAEEKNLDDVHTSFCRKVEEMELRIEKLEEELREVAALEISLYSFVPEHGSSAHKVHTPARRLARLYVHAWKHWSQDKLATVTKNTISGLALIAKSCGNDVPRLTFWLSNTVVLRKIICQTYGSLPQSSVIMRPVELNFHSMKSGSGLQKFKNICEGKQGKMLGFAEVDDWHEASTYIAALEKLESWIFSRAVESVWWQALTPYMQSPVEDLYKPKSIVKLFGPSLGDPKQRNFSVNLWRSAFHDAFSRLCPVLAGGHECGCLQVLARKVMEQCVCRLDVAMFNAILRESANEIPTDPILDPIVDSKVLPIPAGNLSFGSGAQLKNATGSWARWLEELLGMNFDNSGKENAYKNDTGFKCFRLLNELSDLLMLPKEMILEKSIRNEVCPSIGLTLITRILCNFTPDEFCPESVPSAILEELNSESLVERRLSETEQMYILPRTSAQVVYTPISLPDFVEELVEAESKSPKLKRNSSMVMRRGYTSDEDLDDLVDPIASFIDRTPPVSPAIAGERLLHKQVSVSNLRYSLLRQVWCD
ncbi:uncharacterized protein LOC110025949 [Phalaenopsis equestris]|uniref:uncharacterized protein LOC110025949 n=1 Tax=Phalaenopsis equestris TaxID=78828 RepID=UPI0009E1EA71|nr:uncharacterized protein LOC110025949 [Phalaenopsis equestris]XP_020582310.1 uncharacterized protein LOC110025949 [Phalaenopsis equestris]XP_020582311.1 uncharacterized protein LOC110025949 [Phalaenopsis equestris]XP_020582312.1 uncharacterized protein LOC110025949 [Phalaenopsis equestris]